MGRSPNSGEEPRVGDFPDKGCKYGEWWLGVDKGEMRCEFCPANECIENTPLTEQYLHWPDLVRWLYKHRGLTQTQLAGMFRMNWQSGKLKEIIENGGGKDET